MPRKKPIDRRFLRTFVAALESRANRTIVPHEAIEQFAIKHLDGKTRAQREAAIVGPWFRFLAEHLQRATQCILTAHAARHPSPN